MATLLGKPSLLRTNTTQTTILNLVKQPLQIPIVENVV
jgi:hypothetical protein